MMKGIYGIVCTIICLTGLSWYTERYYEGVISGFISGFCMSIAVFMNVISIILVLLQLKINERKEGTF
ncbi:hypothetical protein M3215_00280 [Bacillus cytotoxicus]|uniref:Uncharacterized protein n=1 Tax=Bacillus cytotoxicus TaxID=580165 RepID=A0ACC6A0Y6_9BACI|nr:hypothetical protein [Bacillus cytotoxicus]HDX9578941.1 hypothetical protein [Bacillus pseudomycoides]